MVVDFKIEGGVPQPVADPDAREVLRAVRRLIEAHPDFPIHRVTLKARVFGLFTRTVAQHTTRLATVRGLVDALLAPVETPAPPLFELSTSEELVE